MATDYYAKQRATVNIGLELERRGWQLLGFHKDQSDSSSDYYHPASWDGVAIHASHPGAVVCVNVSDYTTKNSGKDQVQTTNEPGEPCARCGGSGTEPNALSYEEAKARPSEAHRNKADREAGLPRMVFAFGSSNVSTGPSVSRSDYHQDGRPKCMACHGRGHAMREVKTVLFTWPTFSATPSGRAWHVEVSGRRIATGTGFAKCDDYGERAQNAAAGVVDEIEAAVRRGQNTSTATVTAATSTPEGQEKLATIATGGGITVHAEHDLAKGWTYLQLEPRVSKTQYDSFMARFRGTWHRMRRRPVIYRLVGADELARFFGPLAGEEQAQPELVAAVTVEAAQVPEPTPEATLVDEAKVIAFAEYFSPSLWGGEEQATEARNTRAAHLEAAGWTVTRTVTAGNMGQRGAIVERTPTLKASIPGEFCVSVVNQRVSAGMIRPETAPVSSHLRYLLVRKGSADGYRDVDSGAVDITLRDRYAVLTVLRTLAEALLRTIRSGRAHLSPTVYETLEAADSDAPNHLICTEALATSAAPEQPEAAVEAAPAEIASQPDQGNPLARILVMREEVKVLKIKVEAQIAALKAEGNLSYDTEEAARRPWREADEGLHRFEASTMKVMGVPLAAEEQYLIREWGDAAVAKRNRDIRARAYRAAGWEVKTSNTDGAFYLDAHNPWYSGAVVQHYDSRSGQTSLKRVSPNNIDLQYTPVRLDVAAPAVTPTPKPAQAAPAASEPTSAPTSDETPRPLAEPIVAAPAAPAPVLSLPEPVAAPVATKGKGKAKKGSEGPALQLRLF